MLRESVVEIGDGPVLCFGGPYSNLQATRAMRLKSDQLGILPRNVFCTGDLVAYCADPNGCLDEIRDWGCHVIQGNCERQLARRADDCGCGFEDGTACNLLSRGWYPYADKVLKDEHRDWMDRLPGVLRFSVNGRSAVVIHGGSRDIVRFIFAGTAQQIKREELALLNTELVIAGHAGMPFIEPVDECVWFNAGVIGMPANDGTQDGWFGIIRPAGSNGSLTFSLHRLGYDADAAAGALEATGAAPLYAAALRSGLWPSLDVLPEAERSVSGKALGEHEVTLG